MGQYIVGHDQLSLLSGSLQVAGGVESKKLRYRGDALFPSFRGHISGRLHAQNRDALQLKVLQQVAIVAGNLHHKVLRPQMKSLDHAFSVATGMIQPRFRIRREIRVTTEHIFGMFELFELYQIALIADTGVQGIEGFHLIQLFEPEVGVCKGRHPQIQKRVLEMRPAESTGRQAHLRIRYWFNRRRSRLDR